MSMMRRGLPLLVLGVICVLFVAHLVFTDHILARGDTYQYFYPYWDARDAALIAGRLPLWSPDLFMGIPLLANPQIGTFYPPNWLSIPLAAPDAVRLSIVLHIIWAALGTYALFWRTADRRSLPALIAAVSFAAGGYLGAHVEQINQLQGLAWLPWLIVLFHGVLTRQRRGVWALLLALAWALQIFSGHTQTVFMSGIALGLFALLYPLPSRSRWSNTVPALLWLAACALLALLLTIPQLLPTLELTGMSTRGGGLTVNEATAFSLPPTYLGRALLPSYDGLLFTEYIGTIGVIALALAILGVLTLKRAGWVWLALVVCGLIFALGRYNPLYWLIAELPGFNLFRVPARWLALYALGVAMLAGYGVLSLQTSARGWRKLAATTVISLALMGFAILFGRVLLVRPEDVVGAIAPTAITIGAWLIALMIFLVLAWITVRWRSVLLLLAVAIELWLASWVLPHHDLAPREVYLGQRFTISQMLAYQAPYENEPSPRFLSISERQFDPGDLSDLRARYERLGMDERAQAIALTAVKNQELIAPNLALTWGIPALDGYGGGILPTIYYTQFTSLLLPETETIRAVDGRLGELMAQPACRGACIPADTWLALTDTPFIITDKVFDVVHEGIFYDTTLASYWTTSPARPEFDFTEIRILHQADLPDVVSQTFTFNDQTYAVAAVDWPTARMIIASDVPLLAVTAVDTRTADFLQLMPARWERLLSSDIKLYRRELDAGRAQLVYDVPQTAIFSDDWQGHEAAVAALRAGDVVFALHGDAQAISAAEPLLADPAIVWRQYSPTRLELQVTAAADAYLYLAEAYYPGWQATVNGVETPIYRANAMFRAVPVPAGTNEVMLEFVPRLWHSALWIGGMVWLIACGALLLLWWRAIQLPQSPDG